MSGRIDGRKKEEIRKINIQRNYISHAQGSVFMEMGNTRVVCTATMEEKVPVFLRGRGSGWVTAEYDMIPASSPQRVIRPQSMGRISGRTYEIQRLIGRSLRAAVDLNKLGERTIWVDCDVIEADGGTRTASITGSFIALFDCLHALVENKKLSELPIESFIAAISVGIVQDEILVDLCFSEDSKAEVDMNVVMDSKDRLIEVQSTAEGAPFSRQAFDTMLDKSAEAISELIAMQKNLLSQGI